VLALGGHLKSTVALLFDGQVVVSQHLGDMHSPEGVSLLERTALDLVGFFRAGPERVACDMHPDYVSTRIGERLAASFGVPLVRVQHHHAHVAACIAEHDLRGSVLGLAWDGSGYGLDGTIWGGEALVVDGPVFERVAHLRPFSLPGGARAFREPRLAALGLLWEIGGDPCRNHAASLFSKAELSLLMSSLESKASCPRTTSMGRLFDAVSALAGMRTIASFEGQAAMELEFAALTSAEDASYSLPLVPRQAHPSMIDLEPLVVAVLHDRARGVDSRVIAAKFHNACRDVAAAIAVSVGLPRVVLSGGCFQNTTLTSSIHERLTAQGFEVSSPRLYPPNDGGLSLGQAWIAAASRSEEHDVPRHPG
jgi:hydrogenase maturation protein HypF